MSWNYRLIKRAHEGREFYAIHEVYYNDNGVPESVTQDAVPVLGDTTEEVTHTLIYMLKALTEPTLDYKIFEHDIKNGVDTAMDMLKKND